MATSCKDCGAWGHHLYPGGAEILCEACRRWKYTYNAGECRTCGQVAPLRREACRACHKQAAFAAGPENKAKLDLTTAARTGHQLAFANMHRAISLRFPRQAKQPHEQSSGRSISLVPPWSVQLELFEPPWDFRCLRASPKLKSGAWMSFVVDDPRYARFVIDRAEELAVARGWNQATLKRIRCGLAILTGLHQPFQKIRATTAHALAEHVDTPAVHLIDVLDDLELLEDDAPDPVAVFIASRLAPLPDQIRSEAAAYFDVLHHGTPRRRPRARQTIEIRIRLLVPFALHCRDLGYTTLRQVTRKDITKWLANRTKAQRESVAIRDLFKVLKARRLVFVDPARRIKVGHIELHAPAPLAPDRLQQVAAGAAANPALRVVVALAGMHALFPHEIRALGDSDIDLASRRLRHRDATRPLDDFTAEAVREYRRHRDQRWPGSSNPYLLRTQQTAKRDTSVSRYWLKSLFRGLPVTVESLRQDRLLEEAIAGPDPLRIAKMFGLGAETCLRYVRAATPSP
ncbi:hypothetical protein AB0I10_23840 [Streptomyces sp. NPDC050636]|uniref:hypothetical protein n=1 Tax=Streptomyces sp. NPDC050636 TaxID=3154510 RepID=UPI00341A4623